MDYYFMRLWKDIHKEDIKKISIKDRVALKTERIPILCTSSSRGWYYMNTETGAYSHSCEELEESGKKYQVIEMKKKSSIIGVKVAEDKTYNMFTFIICMMDTRSIIKNPSPRKWEEVCRIYLSIEPGKKPFLLRNRVFYIKRTAINSKWYQLTNEEFLPVSFNLNNLDNCQNYNKCVLIDSPCWLEDKYGNKTWDWTEALKPFRDKYGDIVSIAGNRMVALDNMFALLGFLKYKEVKVPNNKNQKRLNELLSYKLADTGEPPADMEMPDFNYKADARSLYENTQKYAVIQRVDCKEPMCVLRTFFKSPGLDVVREGGRIYIGKDEVLASRVNNSGQFVHQRLLDLPAHWDFLIKDFDAGIAKGTKLEYYSGIMESIEPKSRGMAIWMFLKEPVLERMYKCEILRPVMDKILKRNMTKPLDNLEDIFGKIDISKSDPFQVLGLNKQQAELLVPYVLEHMPLKSKWGFCVNRSIVCNIKTVFTRRNPYLNPEFYDISSIDMDTIQLLMDVITSVYNDRTEEFIKEQSDKVYMDWDAYVQNSLNIHQADSLTNILQITNEVYGLTTTKKMAYTLMDIVIKKHNEINFLPNIYRDYCFMVKQLNMQAQFKPYFSNREELENMHTTVMELFNMQESIKGKNKWHRRRENAKWSKWEYENGSFKVIAPIEPDELAVEGLKLHHCVKSYIKNVADGFTNIMFIRKVADPDTPFYTVEISNSGAIEQVHGLNNCNASEYPGLTEFLDKWVKERKLHKSSNYDKVR